MFSDTQKDLMFTGSVVKDYQSIAETLEAVAQTVDSVVVIEDHKDMLSAASGLYLHIKSLQAAVSCMMSDVSAYLDACKESAEEASNNE